MHDLGVAASPSTPPEPRSATPLEPILGEHESMRAVRAQIRAAARFGAAVLLTGETGTGKGVVARAIHARSSRPDEPFVHLDCASLSGGTVESELFGHERGAFTGAHTRRHGRAELAALGTLFLDEIGELDARLQVKFLRLLQERTFERVGGNRTLDLRARVIAATHRSLPAEVRAGRFRADLFYRLNVLHIHLPPLRMRGSDVVPLARHACATLARTLGRPPVRLSDAFLARLRKHDWPGNVRELRNVIERCLVRSEGSCLTLTDLEHALGVDSAWLASARATDEVPHPPAQSPSTPGPRERERLRIAHILRETGGNVSRAARRLEMSRSTLRYRISAYGLLDAIPRD